MTIQSKPCIVTLMNPEKIHKKNIDFLIQSSRRDLTEWLLKGENLSPIQYKDDRSSPLLLSNTLQDITVFRRPLIIEKVNGAVCDAILEWQPEVQGNEILGDLAYLAALTRNTNALSDLIHHVDNHTIIPSKPDDNTESVVIAVIGGFAPDARAEEALRRWWDDDTFNWQYKAILFTGLLACNHRNITELLPSFLSILTDHSDYFRVDYVTAEAARIIGPDELEKALKPFNNEAALHLRSYIPMVRELASTPDEG